MFLRRFAARSVCVLCFVAIGTVVLADAPTVSVQQKAELISDVGILVHVVVNCGDGGTDGTIDVAARQGNVAGENVDTVSNAEDRQEVTVFIPGLFVPGEAQASAVLGCGLLVSGLDLGRTIKIVEE